MCITAEKERCLAVNVSGRGGIKAVVAALLEVVALGLEALASYETQEACVGKRLSVDRD